MKLTSRLLTKFAHLTNDLIWLKSYLLLEHALVLIVVCHDPVHNIAEVSITVHRLVIHSSSLNAPLLSRMVLAALKRKTGSSASSTASRRRILSRSTLITRASCAA